MLNNFLNLPTFFLCLIAVSISAALSIVAIIIIRKKFDWQFFKSNHEVAGFLFNALGLIYAVLVAFVVYSAWTDYDEAKHFADEEANQVHDLFLLSKGLPQQYHKPISENLLDYLTLVINTEWPLMNKGKSDIQSTETLVDLWSIYTNIKDLKTSEQNVLFAESLRKLNQLTDYRRLRILSSQDHTPAIIWTVIIIGALTSIGFSFFFGVKNMTVQILMTGLFAMTNALILLLVLVLDHPFSGDDKITSEAFEYVMEYIKKYLAENPTYL
ncbi:MAG: hypothetical protein ABIY50_00645 [Ignavibacteria bacterium]